MRGWGGAYKKVLILVVIRKNCGIPQPSSSSRTLNTLSPTCSYIGLIIKTEDVIITTMDQDF